MVKINEITVNEKKSGNLVLNSDNIDVDFLTAFLY